MRTKFHVIQAKLIMSVWCFTVQCEVKLIVARVATEVHCSDPHLSALTGLDLADLAERILAERSLSPDSPNLEPRGTAAASSLVPTTSNPPSSATWLITVNDSLQ